MSQPGAAHLKSSDKPARGTYLSVSVYGDDMELPTDYDSEKHSVTESVSPKDTTIYKSITHKDHQHHKFYKPTSNRSWVLSLFLLAITICIVLLELAIRAHPDANTVPEIGPRSQVLDSRSMLYVRQETTPANATAITTAVTSLSSTTSSSPEPSISTTSQPSPGSTSDTTIPSITSGISTSTQPDDNSIPTTTFTPGQPNPDDQITISTTSSASAPNPDDEIVVTTSQPVPDNQITITTTSKSTPDGDQAATTSIHTPGEPNPDNALAITTTTDQGSGAPNPADQITITTSPTKPAPLDDGQAVTTTTPAPGEPNPDNQLAVTTSQGGSGAPNPADQVTITTNPVTPGQPNPNNQVTITSHSQNVQSTPTNTAAGIVTLAGVASVVSGSVVVSGTGVVGTIPQVAAASVLSGSLIMSGASVIGTVQQDAIQGTSAGAAAVGLLTLTDSAGQPTATVAYTGAVAVTGSDGTVSTISYNGDIVLTDSNGVATKTLSDAVVMTDSNGNPTKTLSYADSTVLTNSNGVATKTVLYTGVATQAAAAVNTDAKKYKFTQGSYFLAVYLPNIIGVLLQSAWLIVFMAFKLMEPFYRLASPGGASAENTLLADYMAAGLSASVFKTAAEGHWVLILVGLVQLCLAIAMVFVSGSMKVVPTAYCETNITKQQPCNPVWVVNTDMIRILEVCLVACFSMIIMIIYLNHKRVSGVYSDPSRISTVADVLVHKPLIHEIRDIPATSSTKDVALDLRDNHYMLGTFVDNDGRQQYGIVKMQVGLDHVKTFTKQPLYKSIYRHMAASTDTITEHLNKHLPFLPDFLCMSFSIILFSIVLAYYAIDGYTTGNRFNNWMNSSSFGPGVLLTVLGVSSGFLVKRKERYSRLSHSYVILSKGPTLASEAVTQSTHTSPFDAVYHASRTGNITLVLLATAAILSDIILMIAPSIPFSPAQTHTVYLTSTFMVLVFSALIFTIIAIVTFQEWASNSADQRSTHCPETLAAVLMRLCASRFVDEKNMMNLGPYGFGTYGDHDEMQKVRYEGVDGKRRYTYGVMEGLDGVQRHMVEEDVHARPHLLGQ